MPKKKAQAEQAAAEQQQMPLEDAAGDARPDFQGGVNAAQEAMHQLQQTIRTETFSAIGDAFKNLTPEMLTQGTMQVTGEQIVAKMLTTPAVTEAITNLANTMQSYKGVFANIENTLETTVRSSTAAAFKEFSGTLAELIDRLAELKENGVLDEAKAAIHWVNENITTDKEKGHGDSGFNLLEAAQRAHSEGKKLVDLLPDFRKQAQERQAAGEDISIFDLLRSYAAGGAVTAIPSLTAVQAEKILYPLDKVNLVIWKELTEKQKYEIKANKDSDPNDINILYQIDFDALASEISIPKQLTAFDKLVYIAVGALWQAYPESCPHDQRYVTLTKIYETMGYEHRPPKSTLDQINQALTKMGGARIKIDNTQEANAYKNFVPFKYDAPLLPFERMTATVNGKTTTVIRLYRQPPLLTFAQQRKHVTTIDRKLLQAPISKTEDNLKMQDYLLYRLSHAENGKMPAKILFSRLYEKLGIETKLEKSRMPDKLKKYLDYYKQCGKIAGYTMAKDSVTLRFKTAAQKEAATGQDGNL